MKKHPDLASGKLNGTPEERLQCKACALHMNFGLGDKSRHWTSWKKCWDRKKGTLYQDICRQKELKPPEKRMLKLLTDENDPLYVGIQNRFGKKKIF